MVAAETDGQKGHGASRVESYSAQSASGKVDGHAVPTCTKVAAAALRVDRKAILHPRRTAPHGKRRGRYSAGSSTGSSGSVTM